MLLTHNISFLRALYVLLKFGLSHIYYKCNLLKLLSLLVYPYWVFCVLDSYIHFLLCLFLILILLLLEQTMILHNWLDKSSYLKMKLLVILSYVTLIYIILILILLWLKLIYIFHLFFSFLSFQNYLCQGLKNLLFLQIFLFVLVLIFCHHILCLHYS